MATAIGDLVIRLTSQTRGAEAGMRRTRTAVNMVTGSVVGLVRAFAPLSGAFLFAGAVRAGEEFNSKMRNSLAIMGNVSEETKKRMRSTAFDVARSTRFGAGQASEAYYFLASAGLKAEQQIAAMPAVAAFAQAGNFDLALATDLATDAQSALGMKAKDAQANLKQLVRVTDVLTKANTLANASSQQFSEALTNKGGAALKIVGKDIEEGVAVLAAWADQGVKGADAGTALNIVLRDLQTKALQNARAFREAKLAVYDDAGEMRNMADIVEDLETKLAGMSDAQKKATLLGLGFADKSVIFIQTLLGTSDAIREYERQLRLAGGTTKEVADKQLTPFQKGWAKLSAAVVDATSALADKMGPGLEDLGSSLSEVVALVKDLSGVIGQLAKDAGLIDLKKALFPEEGAYDIGVMTKAVRGLHLGLLELAGAFALSGDDAKAVRNEINRLKKEWVAEALPGLPVAGASAGALDRTTKGGPMGIIPGDDGADALGLLVKWKEELADLQKYAGMSDRMKAFADVRQQFGDDPWHLQEAKQLLKTFDEIAQKTVARGIADSLRDSMLGPLEQLAGHEMIVPTLGPISQVEAWTSEMDEKMGSAMQKGLLDPMKLANQEMRRLNELAAMFPETITPEIQARAAADIEGRLREAFDAARGLMQAAVPDTQFAGALVKGSREDYSARIGSEGQAERQKKLVEINKDMKALQARMLAELQRLPSSPTTTISLPPA